MAQFRMAGKSVAKGSRVVWRITSDAPLGEFVDLDALPRPAPNVDPLERPEPGWLVSSFELTHGLDVIDEFDTLPGEVVDEWLRKKKAGG